MPASANHIRLYGEPLSHGPGKSPQEDLQGVRDRRVGDDGSAASFVFQLCTLNFITAFRVGALCRDAVTAHLSFLEAKIWCMSLQELRLVVV